MGDSSQDMVAFLAVAADERLLDEDLPNLPEAEQRPKPTISTHKHDRLVATGSLLTGVTLIGGAAMTLYGGWQVLFESGDVLAATHWGWVHVAEYVGLTIDDRQQRATEEGRRDWLASVQPYPRFSVSTRVLADASTRVERVLHKPVLTSRNTFTFVRVPDAEKTFAADAPAQDIATGLETMRRQARLETDRLRELWEAASGAYTAALLSADDDQQRLAAQRAAATALSEHLNASLLEPPLVE
jgi:hypothetical protein